ncbi:NAD(P)/FAD-dependent oxidoreductase [Pontixanthobacter gangjinensis]|uniref:FAD-dependent oxidoreductase n=1 Tax=Christiangramia aestuarii TaxID=1028746 RepID=A0A7M3SWK4_9FLAO|nr:NAD(P)/FAD-dependent oxidoreductase [Christiangramia aestuarii]MUP40985.1 FAD-dependent oxidoreductase [Christiangramia aestuarii]
MDKKDYKIHIIGAGLSGLIAAKVLEDKGYHPQIFEASDEVGGRIRTDEVDGYRLDRGFQVLLSEYPKVKQYLDLENLNVVELIPGAEIFKNGKISRIGDPTRDASLLFSSAFSGVASISDKWKIFRLYLDLKKKDLHEIFEEPETTTLDYLNKKGFSEKVIQNFFRPFFSGIFLEPELKTSSRMFRFVFKMFGEGKALIPKKGMGEIGRQLAEELIHTQIHFNSPVEKVSDSEIILKDGSRVQSHFTIIATEAAPLVDNLRNQQMPWNSCHCFYFTTRVERIKGRMIGLVADESAIINNIFYHSSIEKKVFIEHLISVTVVKPTELDKDALESRIRKELKELCDIEAEKLVGHYHIKQALPDIRPLQYEIMPTETRLNNRIFLAGDQLLNGSQNAAMLSGERAALGLIGVLEGGAVTAELTSEYL